MNVIEQLRKYANDLAANERLLETLESDADTLWADMEAAKTRRAGLEDEIEGIQNKISGFEDERDGLKVAYAESLFDDDQERTDAITARRDTWILNSGSYNRHYRIS